MIKTVISTFAGCGGSILGYKMAGFKEMLAIERDKICCETLRLNFKDLKIFEDDIKKLNVDECIKLSGIEYGLLDILDGSPPCQGFSTAKGKRFIDDDRNDLYKEFVRLIVGLNPKVFVMENVSGMIKGKMKIRFIEIFNTFKSLNYNVKCKLLNSMFYDVPQSRERIIFIGVRKDLKKNPIFPEKNNYIITVEECFKNIINKNYNKELSDKALEIYDYLLPGEDGNKYIYNHYFSTKKLNPKKPSFSITKIPPHGGLFHYEKKRSVTIEEIKRISSFPDDYIFYGNFNQQWGQIGNCVPPKMMYHIARTIKGKIL